MPRSTKIYLVYDLTSFSPKACFTVKYEAIYWAEEYAGETRHVRVESYPDGYEPDDDKSPTIVWESPGTIAYRESYKRALETWK